MAKFYMPKEEAVKGVKPNITPELKKPAVHTKNYWDYKECREYVQKKYKFFDRDVKGKYNSGALYSKATDDYEPYRPYVLTTTGRMLFDIEEEKELAEEETPVRYMAYRKDIYGDGMEKEGVTSIHKGDFKYCKDTWAAWNDRFSSWLKLKGEEEKEHCDFWNWLTSTERVVNGSFLSFNSWRWDGDRTTPEWVKETYNLYVKEFEDPKGSGTANFWMTF